MVQAAQRGTTSTCNNTNMIMSAGCVYGSDNIVLDDLSVQHLW